MGSEQHWLTEIREDAFSVLAGWVNPLTGRGDPERDKSASSVWVPGRTLTPELLRDLFSRNALARAVCMAQPEWGLRNGWDLTLEGDAVDARKTESAIRTHLMHLGAHEAFLRGAVWGQAFGGGLVLVGADDGRESKQPLDFDRLKAVRWLRVVGRQHVDVAEIYDDPGKAMFGEAARYKVQEPALRGLNPSQTEWHESRVIRLPGPTTEDQTRVENEGWDQSILDVVILALLKHDGIWDDVGGMVADGSQGVWKIQGLAKAATTGLADAVQARFRLADQARGMFRSLLLDADKEDFQYVHRQFSGISDLIAQSAVRVAGAAQIPVTVLMGQSPAGMNATGESDLELWYARVRAYQTGVLQSRIHRLVQLIFRSKEGPTNGVEPDSWAVTMADPRSLTPMQRAELRARQSQVDSTMISARVLTPEEVAINRYTSEGWSDVTQIDLSWRRKLQSMLGEEIGRRSEEDLAALAEAWLFAAPQGVQTEQGGDPTDPPAPGGAQGEDAPQNRRTGATE